MTRDDMIRMAREAGAPDWWIGADGNGSNLLWLSRFAEEVKADFLERTGQYLTNDATREAALAAEREACVKACLELMELGDEGWQPEAADCAAAIRARSAA